MFLLTVTHTHGEWHNRARCYEQMFLLTVTHTHGDWHNRARCDEEMFLLTVTHNHGDWHNRARCDEEMFLLTVTHNHGDWHNRARCYEEMFLLTVTHNHGQLGYYKIEIKHMQIIYLFRNKNHTIFLNFVIEQMRIWISYWQNYIRIIETFFYSKNRSCSIGTIINRYNKKYS